VEPGYAVDADEVTLTESSRAEKVLAAGMVVFMLLGGLWVLARLSAIPRPPDYQVLADRFGLPEAEKAYRQAENSLWHAESVLAERAARVEELRRAYEFRREEYRTVLDRGVDDPVRRREFEAARESLLQAETNRDAAAAVRDRAREALSEPEATYRQRQALFQAAYDQARRRRELALLALRFGYALPVFAASFAVWQRLRRRQSRYLILGTAGLAFATIQLAALVGMYGWHWLRGFTQLGVSVAGTAATAAGLVAVRRYLAAPERIARVRLRRGQCPQCGFPRPAALSPAAWAYCPDCGSALSAPCGACGRPRPVGAGYCPACGAR